MLPRCGRVAHICEANNRTAQWQQKSKRESEKSQLPLKSEGCNERQGFRGNCDSQASWGYAPALPTRTQLVFLRVSFQKTSRRQIKVFRCSSFSKMLPRCGRAAHICEANENCMRNYNKNLGENRKESQLPLKLRGCNKR